MIGRRPVAAGLAFGVAALVAACTYPASNVPYCSVDYRGGCEPNPAAMMPSANPDAAMPNANPAAAMPSASPAAVIPGAGPTAASPAVASPAAVPRGNPSDFADVDDKQCRSYGLTFGTRDYADCRIRLSAQHRGLDPNVGATPPAPGSR